MNVRSALSGFVLCVLLPSFGGLPSAKPARYQDLAALFTEWRAFQRPRLVAEVPDYSSPAMAAQHRALPL